MHRVALSIVLFLLIGCATKPAPRAASSATPAANDAIEPVAERLHDVSGSLLLFLHAQKRLPTSLDELCLGTGLSKLQVIDPATGKPFDYRPSGFGEVSGAGTIVLAAETTPGETNRWCVVIDQSTPTPLCRVLSVPEGAVQAGSQE